MTPPRDPNWSGRLDELYRSEPVPEPSSGTWHALFARILSGQVPARANKQRRGWLRVAAGLAAVAASVLLAFALWPKSDEESEDEVLIVATAAEIEIVSMAGADTSTLVVGEPPVKGPLQLLAPGEITVTSIQPSDRDNMTPELRASPPMIWARLDTELDE